eukprot:gene7689-852_t
MSFAERGAINMHVPIRELGARTPRFLAQYNSRPIIEVAEAGEDERVEHPAPLPTQTTVAWESPMNRDDLMGLTVPVCDAGDLSAASSETNDAHSVAHWLQTRNQLFNMLVGAVVATALDDFFKTHDLRPRLRDFEGQKIGATACASNFQSRGAIVIRQLQCWNFPNKGGHHSSSMQSDGPTTLTCSPVGIHMNSISKAGGPSSSRAQMPMPGISKLGGHRPQCSSRQKLDIAALVDTL